MSKHSNAKSRRSKPSRHTDYDVQRPKNDASRRRQLFDPAVDNPIGFNKLMIFDAHSQQPSMATHDRSPDFRALKTSKVDANRDDGMDYVPRGPSAGRLWQGDTDTTRLNVKTTHARPRSSMRTGKEVISDENKNKIENQPLKASCNTSTARSNRSETDQQKCKIKSFFSDIQQIEKNIARLNQTSGTLAFFQNEKGGNDLDEKSFRRNDRPRDIARNVQVLQLSDDDLTAAVAFFRDKMKCHIDLAYKYLEIMRLDYDLCERKSLENLCWKRAIYSMFDQFRSALKLWTLDVPSVEIDMDQVLQEPATIKPSNTKTREVTALLGLCDEFLLKADQFYRDTMAVLYSLDKAEMIDDDRTFDEWMDQHLRTWRRTKRLKWYKSIPFRGDIARYRWSITAEYGMISHGDQNLWEIAWRWYALGIFFMPATGRLYFHLSLLLNMPTASPSIDCPWDLHKLYFGIRSLMVRRNGFVNAREGIIVLLERNRQTVNKYLQSIRSKCTRQSNANIKSGGNQDFDTQTKGLSFTKAIADLFIRLHGMLFTKIGLDQFPEIRRQFFEMLFPSADKHHGFEKTICIAKDENHASTTDPNEMTGAELFWLQLVVLSISALYSYNYPSAPLTKLLTLHYRTLFATDSALDNGTDSKNLDAKAEAANALIQELRDNVLILHGIDLLCQVALELFKCYCDSSPNVTRPRAAFMPTLPKMPSSFSDNLEFIFGRKDGGASTSKTPVHEEAVQNARGEAWLVFIEILLQWMVSTCICVPPSRSEPSPWERLFGFATTDKRADMSKISPAFWYELLAFLNKLLWSVPEEKRYEIVNKHLLPEQDIWERLEMPMSETVVAEYWSSLIAQGPSLPEESSLRGLGWIDETTCKLPQNADCTPEKHAVLPDQSNLLERRKLKILDYGFALVMQMRHVFTYDPVLEQFAMNTDDGVNSSAATDDQISNGNLGEPESEYDNVDIQEHLAPTLLAMDDDVLLAKETDDLEEQEGDDIVTQLKKRREQLQTMLTVTSQEERGHEYKRSYGRAKEREARLKSLRERVIPSETILVLDTNCFIGQLELVKRLIESDKWSIVIPLVVITELDGLSGNAAPLGTIANDALQFIDKALASRARRNSSLRIQTSHNNFLNDISIRYEQFIFGEMDKNLDDLVLSVCLWWSSKQSDEKKAPVCLITGDRNLSVKARARDIDVMSVTAVMQITPRIKKSKCLSNW